MTSNIMIMVIAILGFLFILLTWAFGIFGIVIWLIVLVSGIAGWINEGKKMQREEQERNNKL